MAIFYEGTEDGEYIGHKNRIAASTAYVVSLITSGIMAHSAYLTLKLDNLTAWKANQNYYTRDL